SAHASGPCPTERWSVCVSCAPRETRSRPIGRGDGAMRAHRPGPAPLLLAAAVLAAAPALSQEGVRGRAILTYHPFDNDERVSAFDQAYEAGFQHRVSGALFYDVFVRGLLDSSHYEFDDTGGYAARDRRLQPAARFVYTLPRLSLTGVWLLDEQSSA